MILIKYNKATFLYNFYCARCVPLVCQMRCAVFPHPENSPQDCFLNGLANPLIKIKDYTVRVILNLVECYGLNPNRKPLKFLKELFYRFCYLILIFLLLLYLTIVKRSYKIISVLYACAIALYSFGVLSVISLNTLQKLFESLNPTISAISKTAESEFLK